MSMLLDQALVEDVSMLEERMRREMSRKNEPKLFLVDFHVIVMFRDQRYWKDRCTFVDLMELSNRYSNVP